MTEFNLVIEVLDYWVEDRIDGGLEPMKLFMLIKIGEKLSIMERYIED